MTSERPPGCIDSELPPVASTGVPGLDVILHGGLPREEMHMVQGAAGTGKTTLALQFLRAGVAAGEACVYLTMSQSKHHLERIARSHGWSTDGITVHELTPGMVADRMAARQTVLRTVDVELEELFQDVEELVERVRPRRAVIDSITVVQIVAGSVVRYHREIVALRRLFLDRECTLVAIADHPEKDSEGSPLEVIFHPLSGCVVHLDQEPRVYGDVRRRVRVVKARGLPNNGGYHDLKIRTGGMEVYPRLGAYTLGEHTDFRKVESGIASLDGMLAGGLEEGTSCLIVGPSGAGKSSLATLFVDAAVRAGGHAAVYLMDERPETYVARAEGLSVPLRAHVDEGRVQLVQVDPGEIAPGEFANQVSELVNARHTRVVVIDSVIGYFAAMGAPDVLATQLHELMTWLTRRGVLLIMCGSQESFMSIGSQHAVDVSYLSDTILVLGFYEVEANIHRCLSVVKKKHGPHDTSIRELSVVDHRIVVGNLPLSQFRNLLLPGPKAVGGRGGVP